MQSPNDTAPVAAQVNWDDLSPDSRWALRHVAHPLMDGADLSQVASETGLTRKEVGQALQRLKAELQSQGSATWDVREARVSYVRPLALVVEATDLEAARWQAQARKARLSLEDWLRELANREAA